MRTRFLVPGAVAWCMACGQPTADKVAQQAFDTPDAAAEALYQALSRNDTTALLTLMGQEARGLVIPTDAVQGQHEREVVVAAMNEQWYLDGAGDRRMIVIGNEDWPMPIDIVQRDGKWQFDAEGGATEVLYRRVGRNELTTMEVLTAFAAAQKEYAASAHDGVRKGAYAQRILSSDGRQDGLYWPVADGARQSPMGALVASASGEGYSDRQTPYHGYYYKVLTQQGSAAPGGAKSWIVNGAMTGGYALIAWPADYAASGVMTFMVGPDNVLRQKDLGVDTPTAAPAIDAWNPDSTWEAD